MFVKQMNEFDAHRSMGEVDCTGGGQDFSDNGEQGFGTMEEVSVHMFGKLAVKRG